ncbi:MAG: hypothetical protein ACHP7C_04395 [Lysobacterales bacterium]
MAGSLVIRTRAQADSMPDTGKADAQGEESYIQAGMLLQSLDLDEAARMG